MSATGRGPTFDRGVVRPADPANDRPLWGARESQHINPDIGTSRPAKGSTGQLTRIEIERFGGPLPPIKGV